LKNSFSNVSFLSLHSEKPSQTTSLALGLSIPQSNKIIAFEREQYCRGVFLDVAQAFDRVWHPGLLFKLKQILPSTYYLIL
jgi:hypothetical protein